MADRVLQDSIGMYRQVAARDIVSHHLQTCRLIKLVVPVRATNGVPVHPAAAGASRALARPVTTLILVTQIPVQGLHIAVGTIQTKNIAN